MTNLRQSERRPVFSARTLPPLAALLAFLALGAAPNREAEKLQFNRDIRPILTENCFACHGPDKNARKAGLRLDMREEALKAEAIVPGKPEDSLLIQRIFAEDPKERMPPAKTHKTLTAAQKETLRRWIAAGAAYQPHWSFLAPRRPPAVKQGDWVRNPIDQFVLAELEKRHLQPAPEADRRTLARRLSLDLTGLPPEPADVEAFVADPAPDYYERYVDKLLKSPHWGEHRGRYWLDAARYADTHGIHFDNYREMWSYRDWVINAFNRNMPFDQFTIEQLAGDLLPNRTLDQQIASGFNRCNITTNEGGAIAEEYLVYYDRDRTETTARVWMGLTAGCAVCHDHKFDPLLQREFYELAAYFNNTTQAAMDGNVSDTPPTILVPRAEDRPRWEADARELAELRKQADARKEAARGAFDKWLSTAKAEQISGLIPSQGLRLHATLSEGQGPAVHIKLDGKPVALTPKGGLSWDSGHVAARAYRSQPGGVIAIPQAGDFDTKQAFSYGAWVNLTKRAQFGAVLARMDDQHDYRGWDLWVEENRVGAHIISKWQEDAIKVISNTPVKLRQWNHLFITYDGSGKAAGVKVYINGLLQQTATVADGLKNTIRTTVPLKIAQRHSGQRVDGALIQDVRVYGRKLSGLEVDQIVKGTRAAWLAAKPADKRSAAEKNELFDWWLRAMDKPSHALTERLNVLQQEEAAIRSRGTIAYVMQERGPEPMAYVLYRGEYDKRRNPVKPGTPHILPPMPPQFPRNRLGLAQWLLLPEHPLTARVTVNRFWQEVFGTGIVKTSEDFGIMGELPSNQELLDWLAVEFRESGWNVKKFFKLLVSSATYRQAAIATPDKIEKDPYNRLLSRGPRFRMDAEMIRDYALAASGLLVPKLGGPSVKPYQPEGVWEAVAIIGSNTRDYKADDGNKLYRRSLYTFWKRSAPPASMEVFNAPSREVCTVRRERTNTPLQALVTLNDPQFVEAARYLAQKALKEGGADDQARMDFVARRLLCRPLRSEETQVVGQSLADLLTHYKTHPDDARKLLGVGQAKTDPALDAATLAAWTMVANEMMNLDEVLNK
jgi:mono/diheme cytochrome c family protein